MQRYFGRHGDDIVWDLNRAVLASSARTAVIQMQDALALDTSARMNDPSSYARPVDTWHNFRWRMLPDAASELIAHRLRSLNALYGRQPAQQKKRITR